MSSIPSHPSLESSTDGGGDAAALGAERLSSSFSGAAGGAAPTHDEQVKAAEEAAKKAKDALDPLADELEKAKKKEIEAQDHLSAAEAELFLAKLERTNAFGQGPQEMDRVNALVKAAQDKVDGCLQALQEACSAAATLNTQFTQATAKYYAAVNLVNSLKDPSDIEKAADAAYGAGSKLDVASIMFAALMERDKLLSIQIEAQAATISSENKMMRIANEWMTAVIAKQSQAEQTGDKGKMVDWPPGLEAYLKANGITVANPGQATNAAGFSAIAQAIKMHVDSLSSQSQEDMTRLQQYSNKYNTNNQMCSDFLSSYYQGLNAIMRNIGG